jgi:hypothetical protein
MGMHSSRRLQLEQDALMVWKTKAFCNRRRQVTVRVALVIDLVVEDEMDQIVAALALKSLDFHQGQGDCLGAHCLYSFKNMRFCLFGHDFQDLIST